MIAASRTSAPACRSGLTAVSLYDAGTSPCAIDLSDNTNLWGPPPAATESLLRFTSASIARYPSAYSHNLKNSLASYASVDSPMIVAGCGSDDVLDSAIRAFGNHGDRLAFMDPSFGMIPVFARVNGLVPVPIGLDDLKDSPVERILRPEASILYLCSPNNPTGGIMTGARIEEIVSTFNGLVIIDEAYVEFTSESYASLASRYPNVLVTRTMSKAFGLASLRIGYGIASERIVREVEKSRGPFKVSAVAEAVAIDTLAHGLPWVRERVADMKSNRARFVDRLCGMGFTPLPSEANFVLLPVADTVAARALLREKGIAVRVFDDLPQTGGALRITIGPWEYMEACLVALDELAA